METLNYNFVTSKVLSSDTHQSMKHRIMAEIRLNVSHIKTLYCEIQYFFLFPHWLYWKHSSCFAYLKISLAKIKILAPTDLPCDPILFPFIFEPMIFSSRLGKCAHHMWKGVERLAEGLGRNQQCNKFFALCRNRSKIVCQHFDKVQVFDTASLNVRFIADGLLIELLMNHH